MGSASDAGGAQCPMTESAIDPNGAFTEQAAIRALTDACRRAGLSCVSPGLIRLGSNAVYRVDSGTVARVAASASAYDNAAKQIAVSRWLDSVGYPIVRATEVEQPVWGDGRVVTFWVSIAPETTYAPIADVADLIRRLHELTAPVRLGLLDLQPFGQDADPPLEIGGLVDEDASFLRERYLWARQSFPMLDYALPRGVVHGDANVGNVLVSAAGQAVLIDLDSFSIGPREWDLIQTALFADRFGWHTPDEYRTFVEVYGYDITQWDGYETLADMREVAMTAWLAKKAATDKGAAVEVHKRITAMRTGGSRRDWGAY
jgi:aminoglycoside phosphotransferase (APT) family kinase protein